MMGPEELKREYWQLMAAATDVLKEWDAQQLEPDGDWGFVIAAMERLRVVIFGQVLKPKDIDRE